MVVGTLLISVVQKMNSDGRLVSSSGMRRASKPALDSLWTSSITHTGFLMLDARRDWFMNSRT